MFEKLAAYAVVERVVASVQVQPCVHDSVSTYCFSSHFMQILYIWLDEILICAGVGAFSKEGQTVLFHN
jgi:hypothetical protein